MGVEVEGQQTNKGMKKEQKQQTKEDKKNKQKTKEGKKDKKNIFALTFRAFRSKCSKPP